MTATRRSTGLVAGASAAAAAVGVGELVAGFGRAFGSPVVAIADTVIRYLPPGVKEPAVALLGQGDKPFLVGLIIAVTVAVGAILGIRASRDPRGAVAGFLLLAALAAAAVVDDPRHGLVGAVPAAVAGLVGVGALSWLLAPNAVTPVREPDRRRLVRGALSLVALGLVGGTVGRWLHQRRTIEEQRLAVVLPRPRERLDLPVVDGAQLDVEGLGPAITPNDRFYRIDTAFSVPQIDPATHRVRVTGMVERELDFPFSELLERDTIELPVALSCVSNEVGGDLVGTAVWRGVLLRELLDEAGIGPAADQVVGRSVDGWTCGFPVTAVYDRPTILAIAMNGEPLPARHGFPVRLVTPGLYGYVSATKWLTEVELTRFDRFDQYWVRRGWAEQAPIKIQSRIDVPRRNSNIAPGEVPVAGVAWAPLSGIGRVEVRVDDGPWTEAELAAPINGISWRQWVYRWDARPGSHRLSVRATSTAGETQTGDRAPPKPDGATGWHTIAVEVRGA